MWGPLLGLPVIYEAHDLESWNPSRAKERWTQPLLHLLDRVVLTRSAALVSLTEDFRRLLARLGWRNPDDIAIIPTDKNGNGRFELLTLVASPYVAGPWVEGDYEIELTVTPDLLAGLKSDYRASFEVVQRQ